MGWIQIFGLFAGGAVTGFVAGLVASRQMLEKANEHMDEAIRDLTRAIDLNRDTIRRIEQAQK